MDILSITRQLIQELQDESLINKGMIEGVRELFKRIQEATAGSNTDGDQKQKESENKERISDARAKARRSGS